jgi:hypothetical protein
MRKTRNSRSCDSDVGFSQALENVEGGGLKYDKGGGSAFFMVDYCLKYLFI